MEIKKYLWLAYMILIGSILVGMFGYMFYREAWIFPPEPPADMSELKDWSELDLWRLMEYYNCSGRYVDNPSDDLKEFNEFCDTVVSYWIKKYDERKLEKAREGADRLRQQ